MAIHSNHTILSAHDSSASARFLTEVLACRNHHKALGAHFIQ